MSGYQEKKKKLHGIPNSKKTQFEETEQVSEIDMVEMLKLSVWGFKKTVINMLRALMDKLNNMQEQTGNQSREMEILRKKERKKKC